MKPSLNKAACWFQFNFLLLNESKTQSIVFSLRHATEDAQVKVLGMYTGIKLTWSSHMLHVLSRLPWVIYSLQNLSHFVTSDYVTSAYVASF